MEQHKTAYYWTTPAPDHELQTMISQLLPRIIDFSPGCEFQFSPSLSFWVDLKKLKFRAFFQFVNSTLSVAARYIRPKASHHEQKKPRDEFTISVFEEEVAAALWFMNDISPLKHHDKCCVDLSLGIEVKSGLLSEPRENLRISEMNSLCEWQRNYLVIPSNLNFSPSLFNLLMVFLWFRFHYLSFLFFTKKKELKSYVSSSSSTQIPSSLPHSRLHLIHFNVEAARFTVAQLNFFIFEKLKDLIHSPALWSA